MAKEFLSEKVWYDKEGTGYVMFDVSDSVPKLDQLNIEGRELLSKDEFHCSLIATRKYAELEWDGTADISAREAGMVAAIRGQLGRRTVEFLGFTGEYYLCEKDNEATIIGLVGLKGINELRQTISDMTGVVIDPPEPHVTLYKTLNSQYGIGIRNEEEFTLRCRNLPDEIVSKLRAMIPSQY
jgi:hypothetical protein